MVTVRGPSDDVEKAVKLLMEMSEAEQLSGVTVEIKAKPQHHKFLIGTDVNNIQKVKDKDSGKVNIEAEGLREDKRGVAETREDMIDMVEEEDGLTNCRAEKLPDIMEIETTPTLKSGSWEGQCGHAQ